MSFVPDEQVAENRLHEANRSDLLIKYNYTPLDRYVLPIDGSRRTCFLSSKVKLVDTLKIYDAHKHVAMFNRHVPPLLRVGLCKYRRKYFLEYDVTSYTITYDHYKNIAYKKQRRINIALRNLTTITRRFKFEQVEHCGQRRHIVTNFCI